MKKFHLFFYILANVKISKSMDRLFKEGLITTICGLIIILTSVLVWAVSDVDATETTIIAGIGTGLLFMKDKTVGL